MKRIIIRTIILIMMGLSGVFLFLAYVLDVDRKERKKFTDALRRKYELNKMYKEVSRVVNR